MRGRKWPKQNDGLVPGPFRHIHSECGCQLSPILHQFTCLRFSVDPEQHVLVRASMVHQTDHFRLSVTPAEDIHEACQACGQKVGHRASWRGWCS